MTSDAGTDYRIYTDETEMTYKDPQTLEDARAMVEGLIAEKEELASRLSSATNKLKDAESARASWMLVAFVMLATWVWIGLEIGGHVDII